MAGSMTTPTDAFEPTSRTCVSQGLKLHYLDWGGDAGAPVLLLVHGMRDHARSWDWTARALRGDWRVIAVDLRGHGDSDWSPDGGYLGSYHLLDLADLIDHLGCEQLTIVAHSFGGAVSARYAAAFPERVRKLVLVDGMGPSQQARDSWAKAGPVNRTRDWVAKRRGTPPRRLKSLDEATERMAAANPHLSPEQARHLAVHGVRAHAEGGFIWKYDPLVSVFPVEEFTVDLAVLWREIAAPTLICYGPESWTSNPKADGRAAIFRDQRTVIFDGAGHWLHHDKPDAFLAALCDFL
jgi:pimeloyl-ACP methyl ester carboxylesterase